MDNFDDEDYMFNVVMSDAEEDEEETYYSVHADYNGNRNYGTGGCCCIALLPVLTVIITIIMKVL